MASAAVEVEFSVMQEREFAWAQERKSLLQSVEDLKHGASRPQDGSAEVETLRSQLELLKSR